MLVLSRKLNQKIKIADNITIEVLKVKGNTVRLGITAPMEIRVLRGELDEHQTNHRPSEAKPNQESRAKQLGRLTL